MVTKEEVKHLGWLARIELSDAELERYTSQIEGIIKYLDRLDAMPLEQAMPIVVKKKFADLRQDEPAEFEGDALGTKYRKDGFVKGPRMT
ncbi:MAG TPA: Asp-tRNA(Asn)/Glu-tRNA(Gln) amidotransferase subunit GatC [Nitrososphaera sp.]|nr:Asp-tRNA(Asn)/Glu-tRNA(Gln) amidotransferase subunit GatC [Nitrososphaera sp.]